MLQIVPIPSFHLCKECDEENSKHKYASVVYEEYSKHEDACRDQSSSYESDPRLDPAFDTLSPYEACVKLMPITQKFTKNLLSIYNLKQYPEGFERHTGGSYESNYNDDREYLYREEAYKVRHKANQLTLIRVAKQYSEHWLLKMNVISLAMATEERDDGINEPHYFSSAFCGGGMDFEYATVFREWFAGYIYDEKYEAIRSDIASDEHIRSIVDKIEEDWLEMVRMIVENEYTLMIRKQVIFS